MYKAKIDRIEADGSRTSMDLQPTSERLAEMRLAVQTAYRMGRKDTLRYATQSIGEAHCDSATVDRFSELIWSGIGSEATSGFIGSGYHPPLKTQSQGMRTKYRLVVQEMLSAVGDAMALALEEAPPDPVDYDAIVRAATMEEI